MRRCGTTNAPRDTTAPTDNFAATDYGVPDELKPGTVSATARGTTTASLSSTDASGGTPPYAYQWHRSTENDFTPIPATALSGETSLTLDDTGLDRATTYHWKLVYTDDEDETATSTQATLTTAQLRCVCDGNSLTSGGGETPYYPTQLADLLGTPWVVNNKGVTSQTTLQMSADATTDIDPLYEAENTKNVLVAWEGTNHVYFNATASAAITALFNYCTARRAAGFKVVLLTLLPRGDFPGSSTLPDPKEENHEDRRAVVNMWIRQTWDSCADALADVAADERIGLDGCEDDTTYYMADKVHMKSAGYAIIADIVYDAIQNLPTEPPAETTNLIALIPSAGAETQFTDTPRTPGTYHYVGTPVQQRRGVGRSERRHRSDNPLTNDPPQTWSNRHGHLARRTRSRHEDERRTRRSHARPRRKRRRPAAPRNRPASREHLARRSGARRCATRRRPRKPSPTRRRALRADPDQPGAPTLKIRRLTSARAERSKDTSHPRETQQRNARAFPSLTNPIPSPVELKMRRNPPLQSQTESSYHSTAVENRGEAPRAKNEETRGQSEGTLRTPQSPTSSRQPAARNERLDRGRTLLRAALRARALGIAVLGVCGMESLTLRGAERNACLRPAWRRRDACLRLAWRGRTAFAWRRGARDVRERRTV